MTEVGIAAGVTCAASLVAVYCAVMAWWYNRRARRAYTAWRNETFGTPPKYRWGGDR